MRKTRPQAWPYPHGIPAYFDPNTYRGNTANTATVSLPKKWRTYFDKAQLPRGLPNPFLVCSALAYPVHFLAPRALCTVETSTYRAMGLLCVQAHVKSEAEDEEWNSRPIRVLTGSNFEAVVRRSGRHVIVLFCM